MPDPHPEQAAVLPARSRPADGLLMGLLLAVFYGVFTLLPGSNSMMVFWPWVFLWQVNVTLPVLWVLWQTWFTPLHQLRLGSHLDWVAGAAVLGLLLSTITAEFPAQARWYGWAALGTVAALYSVNGWLTSKQRRHQLLVWQGGLGIAFILLSLGLWLTQTFWPELSRLSTLQLYGVNVSFSFQLSSLRNWHPIGHQNYVAGYLLLIVPLLAGLGWVAKGRYRWLWLTGAILGLVDLYTTSSRGGWLGLMVAGMVAFAIALWRSPLPRRWLVFSGLGFVGLAFVMVVANNRLRSLLLALAQQQPGGELAYRWITHVTAWAMGSQHPWTGLGLGSVPLLYQAYRPTWAGREAELVYQLHGTPAQLWAELGIWGIGVPLLAIALLTRATWRWMTQPTTHPASALPPILPWSLLISLLAYGVCSLTDYQLDNIGISGTIVIYLAVLAREFRSEESPPGEGSATDAHSVVMGIWPLKITRWFAVLGLGLTLAVGLWLLPIHRAWQASNEGFYQLRRGNLEGFVQYLTQAHQWAPWEPYYAHQLGWNLGEYSYRAPTIEQQQALRAAAIPWFQTANRLSPAQEFGHSNLGWLLLETDPAAATQSFAQAAQLMAAKPGVFFGIGLSLLQQNQPELAVNAFSLELMRHPMLITSPVWRIGQFASIYDRLMQTLEDRYTSLLADPQSSISLQSYCQQMRGGLRWWQGDWQAAAQDWGSSGVSINQLLLSLAQDQPATAQLDALPDSPSKLAVLAWFNPQDRRALLARAWVSLPEDLPQLDDVLPPPEVLDQLVQAMEASSSFRQWLQENAPTWQPRSERLGFGVLSRHIDGPTPVDFYPRIENIPMVRFFAPVFVSAFYMPELDTALQPWRDELGQALSALSKNHS